MRKTAKAQRSEVLSSIINKAGGEVTVQLISDAHNDSFSDYYREYEDLTMSKLKKDINAFYKGAGVQEITQYYQGQISENVENMPSIEDFRNPNKDYELPRLNPSDLFKLGKEDKPVILKKNIIEKNKNNHPEVDISEYGKILTDTLVDTSEIIQAQPQKKPNYYTFINDNQNDVSVVELSENKDNYEVVNFFKVNKRRIDEYRKKAVKDGGDVIITERKPQGAARLSALLNNSNNSITPKEENVKLDYQNKPQPKGLYDANKGVIKIFESADFSTLPHELAHYWLDNMWRYVRSGNASEKYRQRWNIIANWLNVKQEQAFLTRGQQEKFARGYEQYLLNGNLPTPIIKGAFDDYDRWLKRVYGDMNRLNVRHIDYKKSVQMKKGRFVQPLNLRKTSLSLVVRFWELDLMDLAFGRENVNVGYLMAGRIKFLTRMIYFARNSV